MKTFIVVCYCVHAFFTKKQVFELRYLVYNQILITLTKQPGTKRAPSK